MYFVKTPAILKPFASDLLWKIETSEKNLYLTFDDGPTPDITEQTLGLLKRYNAKATFFCLGKNVAAHPDLFELVKREGHSIGNHSFSHLDGWRTDNYHYIRDVLMASKFIKSTLFRPPYGHITRGQINRLKSRFKPIMWDVISGDFDLSKSVQDVIVGVKKHSEAGSIVVFHDNVKSGARMLEALAETLRHFSERGFAFKAITQEDV